MSDTKELFELAQLAEASYALLENAVNNATETIAALRAPIAESIGSDSIDSVIKPKIFLERKSYLWKPHGYWLAGQVI